jgi:hypothetical protein
MMLTEHHHRQRRDLSLDALIAFLPFIAVDAIAPATLTLDQSGMMGQSNVSVVVGRNPGTAPDLPTAIGSPMSVYYTTVIRNDSKITLERDGRTFTAPDIDLYEPDDADAPSFTNVIPLELRPLGGISVQYIPTLHGGARLGPGHPSRWGTTNRMDFRLPTPRSSQPPKPLFNPQSISSTLKSA